MEETKSKVTEENSLSSSCPELESGRSSAQSEEHKPTVQNLLSMYEKMIQFVQQEEFGEVLQKELNDFIKGKKAEGRVEKCEEHMTEISKKPEYLDEFELRKEDLKRMECGITITGETSSGKTSLMNKLVGYSLVTPRHLPATSTIVRIRNSKELKCEILKNNVKKVSKVTSTEQLRKKLNIITNRRSVDVKYIDVFCPFKRLQVQGNVMLVDTPGIGESDQMTELLLDYIPNSFAFIVLIDVSRYGGIHKDRILKILQTIEEQISKMPCFEREDVLFVTNKWNHIVEAQKHTDFDEENDGDENDECEETEEDVENFECEEDSDDESNEEDIEKKSEREKTWDVIVNKLREIWPTFDLNKVYRLNLQKETEEYDKEEERAEFEKFCNALTTILEKNKNKRKQTHMRFLKLTIENIESGISARINALTGNKEEDVKKLMATLTLMDSLKTECVKMLLMHPKYVFVTGNRFKLERTQPTGQVTCLRLFMDYSEV